MINEVVRRLGGVMSVVLAIALVNAVAFTIWRLMPAFCDRSMRCVQYQGPRPDQAINYLIAGNVAQPREAFQFLLGDLPGEIIFCNYRQCGWDVRASAEEICYDIALRTSAACETQLVRIYAISCADMVAQYLDTMRPLMPFAEIEIVAINPAPCADVLKPYAKYGLKIVAPLLEIVCHAAGFLSLIPMTPSTGSWHSPILLADQWLEIAYADPPRTAASTTGVIISSQDAFLVNEEVCRYFAGVRKIEIEAAHADTFVHPNAFASACQAATEIYNFHQRAGKLRELDTAVRKLANTINEHDH